VIIVHTFSLQDIEQYLSAEDKKERDVINVRLENIKLKNKLKKKEHQLKSKVCSFMYCHNFTLNDLLDGLNQCNTQQIHSFNLKLYC